MGEQGRTRREPSAADYRAADQVLPRLAAPPPAGSDLHGAFRQYHAQLRADLGANKYDLVFGLRHPRSPMERLQVEFWQGRISAEEFRSRMQADAVRPLDMEMLETYCDGFEERLVAYQQLLQAIARTAACGGDQRLEADRCVERMKAKLPMSRQQVMLVSDFLTELQAAAGTGPVRHADFSGATAHVLADAVMRTAAQEWRRCQDTARRRYAPASTLFCKQVMPALPSPGDLLSLVQLERARAIAQLRSRQTAARTETVNLPAQPATGAATEQHGKKRIKRAAAEPLIAAHLMRRPHDTARELAERSAAALVLWPSPPRGS